MRGFQTACRMGIRCMSLVMDETNHKQYISIYLFIYLFTSQNIVRREHEMNRVKHNDSQFNVKHTIENAFQLKFDEYCTKADVAKSLFDLIHPIGNFSFLFIRHAEHALYLSHEITKLYIIMRMFYAVRFINHDLKSNAAADTKGRQCVRRTEKSRKMKKIMRM
jgi:hypothetical protein